jgi:hypothetical protein
MQTGRGTRVTNTNTGPNYTGFRQEGLALATVRDNARAAGKPVPKNDKGTEFCLSYHVLGFCWEGCSRREDHKVHSFSERATMTNWCKECYREGGPH